MNSTEPQRLKVEREVVQEGVGAQTHLSECVIPGIPQCTWENIELRNGHWTPIATKTAANKIQVILLWPCWRPQTSNPWIASVHFFKESKMRLGHA